jgi:hypothetical protein
LNFMEIPSNGKNYGYTRAKECYFKTKLSP